MVTERNAGGKYASMRTSFETYLDDFGTTVTLRSYTETTDSMNRVTDKAVSTSTIKADIQYVGKKELQYLNVGEVEIGDGMLFVKYNENINIEDEVVFNSEYWRVVSQIEGELVEGEITYKGYIIRKNAQS